MSFHPPELSRRAVLSGLAAAAASGLAQPAMAIAPMANAQVPAAYRFKLGGFEIQGYYYSRPLPQAELAAYLDAAVAVTELA